LVSGALRLLLPGRAVVIAKEGEGNEKRGEKKRKMQRSTSDRKEKRRVKALLPGLRF